MHSWIDVVLRPLTAMGIQFRTEYELCYVIIATTAITNVVTYYDILVQELGCIMWFVKPDSIQPGRLETHLGGGGKNNSSSKNPKSSQTWSPFGHIRPRLMLFLSALQKKRRHYSVENRLTARTRQGVPCAKTTTGATQPKRVREIQRTFLHAQVPVT